MSSDLGQIKKVDIRSQWPHEAQDFTPWLAQDKNIRAFGNALGLELEVEGTEVAVGPYSADILARDTGTGEYVVIESQLERTNHDHLGKAITYAAALDASAIIWVAKDFTDEHRRALDWLNDLTSDEVSFFGVQVELWQIDDSRPAVRYNLVSRPSELRRADVTGMNKGELTETRQLQVEYWTAFIKELEKTSIISQRKPAPRHWFNVAVGRSGFFISNIVNSWEKKISVRLYMRWKYNSFAALEQLLLEKVDIEKEIGQELIWDANPDARDKTIAVHLAADIMDKSKWPDYLAWMVYMTSRFHEVFSKRVKALDLTEHIEEEGVE